MIDRLRKRFIVITMCSVTIVLAILMGVVNTVNYLKADRSAAQLLSVLAENGGSFPELDRPGAQGMRGDDPDDEEDAEEEDSPDDAEDADPPDDTEEEDSSDAFRKDREQPPLGMTKETPYETRYFSVVFDRDGTLSSVNTGRIAAISTDEAVEMARELKQTGKTAGYLDSYKYQVVGQGDSTMYLFLDCTRSLRAVRDFFITSMLVSLCGIIGVLVLVLALSRRAIRPVAESYEKQKRFITDAGHELKTPLAIIDSCTEVIELENGESKWTQGIRGQVRRMDSLTKSLVALARMDERSTDIEKQPFDFSAAAEDTLEPFVLLASTAGKRMTVQVQHGITYCGNEGYLRQLVSILADNAVKYASDDSEIRFALRRAGGRCVLTCENRAEGLKKGNLDVLFDRFYRGDASRSRETGGSGIGLSMAQSIVLAHGGTISAVSEDGEHLCITAQL